MPSFSHYYQRFIDKINGCKLKDYWGIQIKPNETLDIYYTNWIYDTNGRYIHFIIEYSKTYSLDFIGLPREISDIVNEYAKDTIEIQMTILYPENYPFRYPTWEIMLIKHNTRLPLETMVSQIMDNMHCNYQKYWSPIIRIETQLLGFFTEIYTNCLSNKT